jgi:cell division protein FtsB
MARSKRRISHKKELYYIVCIVALFAILIFSIFGPGGYRELQKSQIELQAVRERIDRLKRENLQRVKNIDQLRTDKQAIEKIAREKDYAKPDEIIQQVPEEQEEKTK